MIFIVGYTSQLEALRNRILVYFHLFISTSDRPRCIQKSISGHWSEWILELLLILLGLILLVHQHEFIVWKHLDRLFHSCALGQVIIFESLLHILTPTDIKLFDNGLRLLDSILGESRLYLLTAGRGKTVISFRRKTVALVQMIFLIETLILVVTFIIRLLLTRVRTFSAFIAFPRLIQVVIGRARVDSLSNNLLMFLRDVADRLSCLRFVSQ